MLINLTNKPDWYLKLHPEGKVPLLRFKGDRLIESDLVMQFVDQFKGDESSLLSVCGEEAFKKALQFAMPASVFFLALYYNSKDFCGKTFI